MIEREGIEEFFIENQGRLLVVLVIVAVVIAGLVGWWVGRGVPEQPQSAAADDPFAEDDETAFAAPIRPSMVPPGTTTGSIPMTLRAPGTRGFEVRAQDPGMQSGRGGTRPGDRVSGTPDIGAVGGMGAYEGAPSMAYTRPSNIESGRPIISPHPTLPEGTAAVPSDRGAHLPPPSATDRARVQSFNEPVEPPLLSGVIAVYDPYLRQSVPDPGARVEIYPADSGWDETQVLEAQGRLKELMAGRQALAIVEADDTGRFVVESLEPGEYIVAVQSGRALRQGGERSTHYCHGERVKIKEGEPQALSHVFGMSGG